MTRKTREAFQDQVEEMGEPQSVGQKIRMLRLKRGLTSLELGKMAGVSQSTITLAENDSYGIAEKTRLHILSIARGSVDDQKPEKVIEKSAEDRRIWLSPKEQELVGAYRCLTDSGRWELIKHSRLMIGMKCYQRSRYE